MIRFEAVTKHYPTGKDALTSITLDIDSGEMVFITGHSGAGKSTLLKMIPLIETATRGHVIVDGMHLGRVEPKQIPALRRRIGMIFQDYRLLQDRTIFDNVALPLVIAGLRQQEIGKRVRAALDKVGLLGKEHFYPVMLSGGEQQRVGIARAVVNKPMILLADEPTGNLDADLGREIMGLFTLFNQLGATVLIATHNLELVGRLQKRVVVLRQGRLVQDSASGFSLQEPKL